MVGGASDTNRAIAPAYFVKGAEVTVEDDSHTPPPVAEALAAAAGFWGLGIVADATGDEAIRRLSEIVAEVER